jgi:hypothetical protein
VGEEQYGIDPLMKKLHLVNVMSAYHKVPCNCLTYVRGTMCI